MWTAARRVAKQNPICDNPNSIQVQSSRVATLAVSPDGTRTVVCSLDHGLMLFGQIRKATPIDVCGFGIVGIFRPSIFSQRRIPADSRHQRDDFSLGDYRSGKNEDRQYVSRALFRCRAR